MLKLFLYLNILIGAFAMTSYADINKDLESIKAMTGCYQVRFNFVETYKFDPNYKVASAPYQEWGIEWVELDKETDREVHLQHILITPQGPLRHWRQEWQYSPTQYMSYLGNNTWDTNYIKGAVNAWVQRVYQVDDSPRYECVAQWTHGYSEGSYWECTTDSPLPRREFTKRNDYNILNRNNRHQLTEWGWRHEERNKKIAQTEAGRKLLAEEIGANTYKKLDDSECLAATVYWAANKRIWNDIQDMWKHVYSHHPKIQLKSKVNEKTLWMSLFELADKYSKIKDYSSKDLQKEAHDIIHLYFENHK